jgi:GT2 family glycosyltransferase
VSKGRIYTSVIICTYNRAPSLRSILEVLKDQTFGPEDFEIIVVDDGSRDATTEVCEELRGRLPNLRYVRNETNKGLAASRNRGLAIAEGDHILFTDDDCLPSAAWVERLSSALKQKPIVSGAVASTTTNFLRLCHNIAQFHAVMPGSRPGGHGEFFAGANMAFRRSVFDDLGLFDRDALYGEDTEMILRARSKGYSPEFVPDAVVTHIPDRQDLSSVFSYAVKHASATIHLRNRYRLLLKTPFILRSPSLILIFAPLIAIKVTFSIYLRNPQLLRYPATLPVVLALKFAWCWGASRGLKRGGCFT